MYAMLQHTQAALLPGLQACQPLMVLAPALRITLGLLVIAACTTLVSHAGKSHVEGAEQPGCHLPAEHACCRWSTCVYNAKEFIC